MMALRHRSSFLGLIVWKLKLSETDGATDINWQHTENLPKKSKSNAKNGFDMFEGFLRAVDDFYSFLMVFSQMFPGVWRKKIPWRPWCREWCSSGISSNEFVPKNPSCIPIFRIRPREFQSASIAHRNDVREFAKLVLWPVKSWHFLTYLPFVTFFFGLSDPNVCPFHSWIFGSRAASCLGKKRPVRVLQPALCMEFCCTTSWSKYHQLSTLWYHLHIFLSPFGLPQFDWS